jgi:hypothetical protein
VGPPADHRRDAPLRSGARPARLGALRRHTGRSIRGRLLRPDRRPPTTTTPQVWAEFASACLERLQVLHHYSNFHIELHGDTADGVFYHQSRHKLPNKFGEDTYYQYGWYENSFGRFEDGWKITKLKHTFQWCDGNPTLIDVSDPDWQAAAAAVFGA